MLYFAIASSSNSSPDKIASTTRLCVFAEYRGRKLLLLFIRIFSCYATLCKKIRHYRGDNTRFNLPMKIIPRSGIVFDKNEILFFTIIENRYIKHTSGRYDIHTTILRNEKGKCITSFISLKKATMGENKHYKIKTNINKTLKTKNKP